MIVTFSKGYRARKEAKIIADLTGSIYMPRGSKSIEKLVDLARFYGQERLLIITRGELRVIGLDESSWDYIFRFPYAKIEVLEEPKEKFEAFSKDLAQIFGLNTEEGEVEVRKDGEDIVFLMNSQEMVRIHSRKKFLYFCRLHSNLVPFLEPETRFRSERSVSRVYGNELEIFAKDGKALRASLLSYLNLLLLLEKARVMVWKAKKRNRT